METLIKSKEMRKDTTKFIEDYFFKIKNELKCYFEYKNKIIISDSFSIIEIKSDLKGFIKNYLYHNKDKGLQKTVISFYLQMEKDFTSTKEINIPRINKNTKYIKNNNKIKLDIRMYSQITNILGECKVHYCEGKIKPGFFVMESNLGIAYILPLLMVKKD